MSSEHDERVSLDGDDAEFVSRVADGYAPDELTPVRRAELDAELRARVQAGSGWTAWQTIGLAAATAGALAITVLLAIDRVAARPSYAWVHEMEAKYLPAETAETAQAV